MMLSCQNPRRRGSTEEFATDDDLQSLEWLQNFDITQIAKFSVSDFDRKNNSTDLSQKIKPSPCSFGCLIFRAIEESQNRALPLESIYRWIEGRFPDFVRSGSQWKNTVRHSLSLDDCFVRLRVGSMVLGRSKQSFINSSWWTVHPDFRDAYSRTVFAEGATHRCLPRSVSVATSKSDFQNPVDSSDHELAVLVNDIKAAATIKALKEPFAVNNPTQTTGILKRQKPLMGCGKKQKRQAESQCIISKDIAEDHRYYTMGNTKREISTTSSISMPSSSMSNEFHTSETNARTTDASVQVCFADFEPERQFIPGHGKNETQVASGKKRLRR